MQLIWPTVLSDRGICVMIYSEANLRMARRDLVNVDLVDGNTFHKRLATSESY